MSILRSLFHNKLGSKRTALKNRAVLAVIVVVVFCGAVVFCGLLGLLGTSQGHTSATQMETRTVPSRYFELTVSPAEVCANVGERIEIYCTMVHPLVYTPIEITSVYVVLFDSYNSTIREQAMTTWRPDDGYHFLSADTEYTIIGDEAYYKLQINFCYLSFRSLNCSGEYTDYTARSFPIVVNQ
jgi:hypothetical protein